jgi:hypothetical protein
VLACLEDKAGKGIFSLAIIIIFFDGFLSMNMSKVNKAIKKLEEIDYHSHSFA